jgi:hypothetical protein
MLEYLLNFEEREGSVQWKKERIRPARALLHPRRPPSRALVRPLRPRRRWSSPCEDYDRALVRPLATTTIWQPPRRSSTSSSSSSSRQWEHLRSCRLGLASSPTRAAAASHLRCAAVHASAPIAGTASAAPSYSVAPPFAQPAVDSSTRSGALSSRLHGQGPQHARARPSAAARPASWSMRKLELHLGNGQRAGANSVRREGGSVGAVRARATERRAEGVGIKP